MQRLFTAALCFVLLGCINVAQNENRIKEFATVKVETILERPVSIRALHVCKDYIFYSGTNSEFGYLNTADHSVAYIGEIDNNTNNIDFRALAKNKEDDFILSAGNPALLYKVNYFGKRKLVYQEAGEKVFYDAMAFFDTQNGIAIGDPTENCMSVIITQNGGETWKKVPCENLVPIMDGEAAFAASNSNIAIKGDKVWFATGGKASRIYFSEDRGENWQVFETPFIHNSSSTGIYSIDFYNDKIGAAIGGDYTNPNGKTNNKAITNDGGKTWQVVANGELPGYKSSIRFVPNSDGREIVAVGFTGIDYSSDYGKTWKTLSDEAFYTIRFLNDFTAYAAGKGRIAKLTFTEKDLLETSSED
ncbi:oxidoreductase [Mesonia sp. K7]|uniref:WD40/YVTN/BNR-like repeat-containing protein n=1 Tax=Mesonia sp. K7 TaxID=2218606 RepID=UPI000DA99410|nr:oxidoreductase [Mesonia sp. K7]PZD77920.1 oxidoreductase [Mesonia sp. K7]